jgi:hypothetical protein
MNEATTTLTRAGGEEQIRAFGSKQFATKFPQAHAFIKNFKLDLVDVERIQHEGNSAQTTTKRRTRSSSRRIRKNSKPGCPSKSSACGAAAPWCRSFTE